MIIGDRQSVLDHPPRYRSVDDAPTRKGSGTHHHAVAPRRGLYHWLSVAVAKFEVGKTEEAHEAAQKLVDMLREAKVLK